MVDQENFLIHADGTVFYFAYTDTSYILIVVDGADEYLGGSFRISQEYV